MDQEVNGHLHLYPGSGKLVATECWNSDVAGQTEDFDKLIYYFFFSSSSCPWAVRMELL